MQMNNLSDDAYQPPAHVTNSFPNVYNSDTSCSTVPESSMQVSLANNNSQLSTYRYSMHGYYPSFLSDASSYAGQHTSHHQHHHHQWPSPAGFGSSTVASHKPGHPQQPRSAAATGQPPDGAGGGCYTLMTAGGTTGLSEYGPDITSGGYLFPSMPAVNSFSALLANNHGGRFYKGGRLSPSSIFLGQQRTKNESLAESLGIPRQDVDLIVNSPMEEFAAYAAKNSFSEEQMNIAKDIRRRGKNLVAAHNCRRRKIDEIEELRERLNMSNLQTQKLLRHKSEKIKEKEEWLRRIASLEMDTLQRLNRDPRRFKLEYSDSGQVEIVKKY